MALYYNLISNRFDVSGSPCLSQSTYAYKYIWNEWIWNKLVLGWLPESSLVIKVFL